MVHELDLIKFTLLDGDENELLRFVCSECGDITTNPDRHIRYHGQTKYQADTTSILRSKKNDPPPEFSEEAMRRFWERDRIPEDTLKKMTGEFYRPLRSGPDQNPFKKLEREEPQDDSSLD